MPGIGEQAISKFFLRRQQCAHPRGYISRNIFNPSETKVERLFPGEPVSRVVVTSTISETHARMNRFNAGKADDATMARRRGY